MKFLFSLLFRSAKQTIRFVIVPSSLLSIHQILEVLANCWRLISIPLQVKTEFNPIGIT